MFLTRSRIGAVHEAPDGGADEQLETNQGADGIARQPEDKLFPASPKHGGTAGAGGALVRAGSPGAALAGRIERMHRSALILTFGGGTNEVQRDIVAAAGLGLPYSR